MKRLSLALLASFLAACSANPTGPAPSGPPEKEYQTGSHIPRHEPVSSSPTNTVDPSALRTMPQGRPGS